jgi:hypothetical protein
MAEFNAASITAVTNILNIQEGSKILICLNYSPDREEAEHMQKSLTERFPGAEFTIVSGVSGIGVQSD